VHTWRKETARRMGVESDVVLPRDLMEQSVKDNPRREAALKAILVDVPWRMAHFGGGIMVVLDKSNSRG